MKRVPWAATISRPLQYDGHSHIRDEDKSQCCVGVGGVDVMLDVFIIMRRGTIVDGGEDVVGK